MAMDRVALVACFWFVFWTASGVVLGGLSGAPGMGTLLGFFFALFSTFAWPWIMPEAVNTWMNHEWRVSRRARSKPSARSASPLRPAAAPRAPAARPFSIRPRPAAP
jgi:hypothetical protein